MLAATAALAAVQAGAADHPAGTASPPVAPAAPLERPATRLLGVSVEGSRAGARIHLRMDGAPRSVGAFVLDDPQRLVIDLFDLRDTNAPALVPVGSLHAAEIRVGRHADKIRVVIDAGSAPAAFARVGKEVLPDGLVVTVGVPEVDDRRSGTPTAAIGVPREAPSEAASEAAAPTSPRPLEVGSARPDGDIRVELQTEGTRLDPALPRAIRVARSWQDTLQIEPGDGAGREGFRVATPHGQERSALAVNRIRLGLLDDRVRLTTRYGRSRVDPAGSFLAAGTDRDRLLGPGAVPGGQAFSQRLDASLWDPGFARVVAFGSYRRVDPLFEWKDAEKRDPFARSGRNALEVGGTIGAGPLGATLSRISEEAEIGASRAEARSSRRSTRATLTASLLPLWQLGDRAWPDSGLSRFAPSSAWLSVTRGDVDRGDSRGGAATRDLSFGASWAGETSSAALGFWRSRYTSVALDLDWSGSGVDLSWGIDRERWGLYAGLGAQRSRSVQADEASSESDVAGYLTFLLRPERFPDLVTTLHVSRYEADPASFAGSFRTDGLAFDTALDFSKYLPPTLSGLASHLRTYYRIDWSRTGLRDPELDHALMAAFEFDF
jgi:hypothetical protein